MGRAFSGRRGRDQPGQLPRDLLHHRHPSSAQAVARYWPTTIAAAEVTPLVHCDGVARPRTAARRFRPLRAVRTVGTTCGDPRPAVRPRRPPPPSPAGRLRPTPTPRPANGSPSRACRCGCSSAADRGTRGATPTSGSGLTRRRWPAGSRTSSTSPCSPSCCPRCAGFEVSRYPLPNLWAVNFVVHGILGWGVASNLRLDTQAKGLAELLLAPPRHGARRAGRLREGGGALGCNEQCPPTRSR